MSVSVAELFAVDGSVVFEATVAVAVLINVAVPAGVLAASVPFTV